MKAIRTALVWSSVLSVLLAVTWNGSRAEDSLESPLEIPAIQSFLSNSAFGDSNPNAPKEVDQFGRLVGLWQADQELPQVDGSWKHVSTGFWVWKYALGGYATQDLWYQGADHLPPYMANFGRDYLLTGMRIYNVRAKRWDVAWMANGAGKVPGMDFGTFQAVAEDGRMVMTSPPTAGMGPQRVVFSDITNDSFIWKSEYSMDAGESWKTFMRVQARRLKYNKLPPSVTRVRPTSTSSQ